MKIIGDRWRVTVIGLLVLLSGCADELSDLQRKAENGEVTAQYNLGVRYAKGRGVPQD